LQDSANILLVEDQPEMQRACKRLLQASGYGLMIVSSVQVAYQHLNENQINLVLLDLKLPDGDGLDVLNFIMRQVRGTKVIVISGHSSNDAILRAGQLGAVKFLAKPFRGEELWESVRGALADQPLKPRDQGEKGEAIVAYIRNAFSTLHTRQQVAEHFGLSVTSVSWHVQKATDQSFKSFLHDCKIEQVKALLCETDLPIKAIAYQSGYQSPQQMAKAFRERAECSPRAYRAKKRAGA